MKYIFILVFCCSFFSSLWAQNNCPKYATAIQQGRIYLNKTSPNFSKALTEFQAAQIAARECGLEEKAGEIAATEIKKVFDGLQKERDEAVKNKEKAEIANQKTEDALEKAEIALLKAKKAEAARAEAEIAKSQAEVEKEIAESEKEIANKREATNNFITFATEHLKRGDKVKAFESIENGFLNLKELSASIKTEELESMKVRGFEALGNIVRDSLAKISAIEDSSTQEDSIVFNDKAPFIQYRHEKQTLISEEILKIKGIIAPITAAEFLTKDKMLICTADSLCKIWETDGKMIQDIPMKESIGIHIAVKDNHFLVGTSKRELFLYKKEGDTFTFSTKIEHASHGVISPKNDVILTWKENEVRIMNMEGHLIKKLLHQDQINFVKFSPDGNFFITCSSDRTAKLWNLEGQELLNLNQFDHAVIGADFDEQADNVLAYDVDGQIVSCSLKILKSTLAQIEKGSR